MLKLLRLYWRLRPQIKELERLKKMTFSVHVAIQMLMMVVQVTNQMADIVPPDYRHYAAFAVGLCQALAAFLAHFRNPDGTPASVAYVKEDR